MKTIPNTAGSKENASEPARNAKTADKIKATNIMIGKKAVKRLEESVLNATLTKTTKNTSSTTNTANKIKGWKIGVWYVGCSSRGV